jgi:hypothetical protein
MAIKFDTFKVGTGGAGSDTLDDVTSRGATTTNSVTVGGVTIGTEYSLPATDGSVDQVISTNGSGTLSFTTLDFTGGLEYKGSYDITAAPSLTSSKKGDFYIITNGPGTIAGVSFNTNDHIVFNQDASSPLTSAMFDKIDNTEPALTLDDVTTNGNTTTNAINVGTITTSGDIMPDADATRTIGDENTRFISLYSDINGAIRFKAKNDNGSAITKGQAVYINGVDGTVPTVALAQANSATTMPAFGVALTNANDQAEVQVLTFGNLTSYDTTTYSLSLGDTVYVSATSAGALTNTAPTSESNLIQNIGKVVRAHASDGVLKIGGAGRSNATPNLDQDKIFLGNASNQAVSTALSSVALSSFNDDLSYLSSGDNVSLLTNDAGYLANINSESVGDLSDVTITAAANGEVLKYNGSAWVDANVDYSEVANTPTNVSTFTNDAGYLANINSESINDLSDVTITTATNGQVLSYNGTNWINSAASSNSLAGLTDVTITAAAAGEYLRYNGSVWVDASLAVVDDSTPSLGGDLDTNGNELVTASNANLVLRPNGTGHVFLGGNTNPAELRLYCESADAHYVGFKSPTHAQLSGSQTWRLPVADGTSGQAITTDGSGNLSFSTISGGGGWTYSAITADPANAQANYHYSCTGTFTITLATSGLTAGDQIRIKNMGSGTITIDPQTVNIDGSTTDYVLDVQYSSITLVSDGTNYEVI